MVVVLPDRQINSLGKRALIGNFVLGNSVAYNFTKMKSSENHLLGFILFSEVLEEKIISEIPEDLPLALKQNFYMHSTPYQLLSPLLLKNFDFTAKLGFF